MYRDLSGVEVPSILGAKTDRPIRTRLGPSFTVERARFCGVQSTRLFAMGAGSFCFDNAFGNLIMRLAWREDTQKLVAIGPA